MARPAVDWPIPVYTFELRDRVLVTLRVPAAALADRVPVPLTPVRFRRDALVTVAFDLVRQVKSQRPSPIVASDLRMVSITTPVAWSPACSPVVRGHYLLSMGTDRPGMARLMRTCLVQSAFPTKLMQTSVGSEYRFGLSPGQGLCGAIPRPLVEEPWGAADSILPSGEDAQALLLHPQRLFTSEGQGWIQATPVHHYARSTAHVRLSYWDGEAVARQLGIDPSEAQMDHALFQKRCTHVYSFPPERIPAAARRRFAHV